MSSQLNRITLVLLPGMDGTGKLFIPFIEKLPAEWASRIVSYPENPECTLRDLRDHVLEEIMELDNVVIVAESFSGPVAYEISRSDPQNLKGVFLAASFLLNPAPLATFFGSIALKIGCSLDLLPSRIIDKLCFDPLTDEDVKKSFYEIVKGLDKQILLKRLSIIKDLEEVKKQIRIPAYLLYPEGDRLVTRKAHEALSNGFACLLISRILGPHFILQSEPEKSVSHLKSFLDFFWGDDKQQRDIYFKQFPQKKPEARYLELN